MGEPREEIVISELLCFLRRNYDKQSNAHLKGVISSFYDDDELVRAKETLLKVTMKAAEVNEVDLEIPRLPRRQGDKKGVQTVDDIMKVMSIIDERNFYDALPRFVAEDLSRIPFITADSTSLIAIMRKMEAFEQRMGCVEQAIDKIHVPRSVSVIANTLETSAAAASATNSSEVCASADTISEAPREVNDNSSDTQWSTVVTKRPRNKGADRRAGTAGPSNVTPPKTKKVIGTKQDNDSSLKPGVTIVKKAVVHIDNLDPDCTKALLNDYLLSKEIPVISCYAAKSWMRADERDKVTAYRVCVPATHRQHLFDDNLWSEGIIIRDWKFKTSLNGQPNSS